MTGHAENDYLTRVLEQWREAFADAEGEHMHELYAAFNLCAARDDWTALRPLLRVLRPMISISWMVADQAGYGLSRSLEATADAQTAEDLHALAARLRDALGPLHDVLVATNPTPGLGHGPAVGTPAPRRAVYTGDPADGGLRGLVAIPLVVVAGVVVGVNSGLAAAVQASRLWWHTTVQGTATEPAEGVEGQPSR